MKKVLLTAALAIGLSSGTALAADMTPPAAYDWTGAYIGLNGGYAFNGDDDVAVTGEGKVGSLSIHGGFFGAQLGYNEQIDNIVLGIEGDWQFGSIQDSDSSHTGGEFPEDWKMSDKINSFGTLRGRVGFAVDHALFYGTGGLAFGHVNYKVVGSGTGFDVAIKDSYTDVGYALGAGVEYAFDDAWSLKAEYMYVNLGSKWLNDGGARTKATPDFHLVRLGINYRF